MATFNGMQAAQRMIDRGVAPYRSCLETVAYAIKGNVNSDSPGSYQNAIDGWTRCPVSRRHAYGPDRSAPAGSVGYATSPSGAGHVWINLGDDEVVSTDTPVAGSIGVTTVGELERRMSIGVLGWTDWFLGHDLAITSPAGDVGEDDMSAAEVEDIKNAIRREGRARLYFDAGVDGKIPENQSRRAVAAKVTDGFIYPLLDDPVQRAGQIASLRTTGYLLIGEPERWIPLRTEQFNNMVEMCNGHLRRIAAEVVRQLAGGATPPTTPATPRGTSLPTRVLN
jgi:hypothetical protein